MASRLQDVIQRGVAASRPLATAVAPGTLYYSTDTGTTDRSDGSVWATYADVYVNRRQVTLIVDGQGSVITTGVKGFISIPVAGTWQKWRLLATDAGTPTSGSIVIDVWKIAYSSYPPTVANTITGSDIPTLSSAIKNESTALTGWTTTFSAGDTLGFNVNSATSVKRVSLTLEYQ